MSLVHRHYHFKYYYCLILQWLYISMALFLGCCIFIAIEFALLIPYLFIVFKNWFTWLQTGCLKQKKTKKIPFCVFFLMILHVGAKQISGKKLTTSNFVISRLICGYWLDNKNLHLLKTKMSTTVLFILCQSVFSRLKDPV